MQLTRSSILIKKIVSERLGSSIPSGYDRDSSASVLIRRKRSRASPRIKQAGPRPNVDSALSTEASTTDVPEILASSLCPIRRIERRVTLKPAVTAFSLFFARWSWHSQNLIVVRWFARKSLNA